MAQAVVVLASIWCDNGSGTEARGSRDSCCRAAIVMMMMFLHGRRKQGEWICGGTNYRGAVRLVMRVVIRGALDVRGKRYMLSFRRSRRAMIVVKSSMSITSSSRSQRGLHRGAS